MFSNYNSNDEDEDDQSTKSPASKETSPLRPSLPREAVLSGAAFNVSREEVVIEGLDLYKIVVNHTKKHRRTLRFFAKGNHLTALPLTFHRTWPQLVELDLSANSFAAIPSSIFLLSSLERLLLGQNDITRVPTELYELGQLVELDFATNRIRKFPTGIDKLSKLRLLNVANNPLKKMPSFGKNSKCKISTFHAGSCGLSSVSSLYLLKDIVELDLHLNKLTAMPRLDADQTKLETLNLGGNKIDYMASDLFEMTSLTNLNLSRNLIEELPEDIGNLKQLKMLKMSMNRLKRLPDGLWACKRLVELALDDNHLKVVEEKIQRLKRLRHLKLAGNKLKYIPVNLARLEHLESLTVLGNPLDFDNEEQIDLLVQLNAKFASSRALDCAEILKLKTKKKKTSSFDDLSIRALEEKKRALVIPAQYDNESFMDEFRKDNDMVMIPRERRHKYQDVLDNCHMFKDADEELKLTIAQLLQPKRFNKKDIIIKQGEEGKSMYIIERGSVHFIVKDAKTGVKMNVGSGFPGSYFGEISLITDGPRKAGVIAGSKGAVVLELSRKKFVRHCTPLIPVLCDNMKIPMDQAAVSDILREKRERQQKKKEKQKKSKQYLHVGYGGQQPVDYLQMITPVETPNPSVRDDDVLSVSFS